MSNGFEYLNSLYKELITESSSSNIKFIYFEPEEIAKYKKAENIYVIRHNDDVKQYNIGDYVKTEWGRIFKIEDIKIYSNIEDCPRLSLLSLDEIDNLTSKSGIIKELKLVKVVKKEIKRFFYDMEFDETQQTKIIPISIGIVDEQGNELYLINKNYNWSTANQWLKLNVYPYIVEAPDYIKVDLETMKNKILNFINPGPSKNTKLYGYYSAYDHVCLCQLFGTMNDLPENMPQYTNDLKQLLDYFNEDIETLNIPNTSEHNALSDAKFNLELFKALKDKYSPKYI